jgi:hypothetical protein
MVTVTLRGHVGRDWMSKWLGREDAWPTHTRAKAELAAARVRGWYLLPSSGHAYGRLACRLPEDAGDDDDRCTLWIWKTARGDASETAELIRDMVRKCPHHDSAGQMSRADLPWTDRVVLATERMDDAERLIHAAEIIAGDAQRKQSVEDLLLAAEEHADLADQLLDEAAAVDLERGELLVQATAAVGQHVSAVEVDEDLTAIGLAASESADSNLDEAGKLLGRRTAAKNARIELARLVKLRARLTAVRSALSTGY